MIRGHCTGCKPLKRVTGADIEVPATDAVMRSSRDEGSEQRQCTSTDSGIAKDVVEPDPRVHGVKRGRRLVHSRQYGRFPFALRYYDVIDDLQ